MMSTVTQWWSALLVHWNELSVVVAFLVFVSYIVLDVLFARYTLAVNRLEAVRAATTGSTMYFLLAFGAFNYVNNPLYVVPVFYTIDKKPLNISLRKFRARQN